MLTKALASQGNYIRREQSYNGVKLDLVDISPNVEGGREQLVKISDKTTEVFREFISLEQSFNIEKSKLKKDYLMELAKKQLDNLNIEVDDKVKQKLFDSAEREGSPFSGVHNKVGIFSTALKSTQSVAMILEQLKQGKKPFILVEKTMQSYVDRLVDEGLAQYGKPFSGTFRDTLKGMAYDILNMLVNRGLRILSHLRYH
jgi:hypothetical protein